MSVEIEFSHIAFRFTHAAQELFIVVSQQGSSNTFRANGETPRHARITFCGTRKEVIEGVKAFADEYVAQGLYRFADVDGITPAEYVEHYHQVLDNAQPAETFLEYVPVLSLFGDRYKSTELPAHPHFQRALNMGDVEEGPQMYGVETMTMYIGKGLDGLQNLAVLARHCTDQYRRAAFTTGTWVPGGNRIEKLFNRPNVVLH